jgi:hypothetical protein
VWLDTREREALGLRVSSWGGVEWVNKFTRVHYLVRTRIMEMETEITSIVFP